MWVELLLGVALLAAWFYRHVTKQFGEFTKRGMPFAAPSFPFGSCNAKKVMSGKLSFFDVDKDLAEMDEFKNEKVFGYFFMGQPTVVINDEEIAKNIMIKDFDHFAEIRRFGYESKAKENQLFHHMLTSMPGDKWKKVRSLLNPAFTSAKLRGMVPHLTKAGRQLATHLDKQEGQDLDGRELFGMFTMDALATGGYGMDTNSFAEPDNIFRKMALTLAGAPGYGSKWDMPRFMFIAMAPSIARLLGIPLFARKPMHFMSGIIERMIKQRQETGERRNDIIDLVLDELKSASLAGEFTPEEKEMILVANALVLFFAGFDSTAIALSTTAVKLIRFPEVQDRVQEELDSILEDGEEITVEIVNKMKYMEQVINESMRHENILTSHERKCTKDYLIHGTSFTIPEGRMFKIYFTNMELDEKNFKNPHQFDPDNFAPENEHNKFAFMNFSQGPRNCIGKDQ
jgi:cytochrome P450 family 6